MSLPATDTFTANNGTALATYNSSWTIQRGGYSINSNAVYSSSSGETGAFWNADSFSNDQYSKGTITALGSSSYALGLAVRVNTGTEDTYYGIYSNTVEKYLFKMVNGTWTELASHTDQWAANDNVELRVSGTTLTPYLNGSVDSDIGAVSDDAIASGAAGLSGYGSSTSNRLDNWEGGNLGASAVTVALDALTAASSLPDITITPGAISVLLDALTAASSLPAGSIAAAVSIVLDALTASSSLPDITLSPGAVSVLLDALTAASSLPAAQVSAAVSILVDALSLASSMPQAGISPGAVSLLLDALSLAGSLPAGSIATESGPQTVALDALSLAGNVPAAQIAAAVSVLLDALSAESSMPDLAVQSAVSVLVQALALQSQAPGLEITISGAVVDLQALQLVAALVALAYQRKSSELIRRKGRFTPS